MCRVIGFGEEWLKNAVEPVSSQATGSSPSTCEAAARSHAAPGGRYRPGVDGLCVEGKESKRRRQLRASAAAHSHCIPSLRARTEQVKRYDSAFCGASFSLT